MQYVAEVSGKGRDIDRVKKQLLQSNPVLEGTQSVTQINNITVVSFNIWVRLIGHWNDQWLMLMLVYN